MLGCSPWQVNAANPLLLSRNAPTDAQCTMPAFRASASRCVDAGGVGLRECERRDGSNLATWVGSACGRMPLPPDSFFKTDDYMIPGPNQTSQADVWGPIHSEIGVCICSAYKPVHCEAPPSGARLLPEPSQLRPEFAQSVLSRFAQAGR